MFFYECTPLGGENRKRGGMLSQFSTLPRGDIYPGGKQKKTYALHTYEIWTRSTQQFRKERKQEEKEEKEEEEVVLGSISSGCQA